MKELTRKEIRVYLSIYTDLSEIIKGTLVDVAKKLKATEDRLIKENYIVIENPKIWKRFEVEIQTDYEGSDELKFYGIRMETDEEFKKRKELNEKAEEYRKLEKKKLSQKKKERDLKEWERLKKKFESTENL